LRIGGDEEVGRRLWSSKAHYPSRYDRKLRGLKSYNGNGILPNPINYSTIFGKDMPQSCGWYLLADKNGFAPTSHQCLLWPRHSGHTTVTK
jgi:hypothetical protein